MIMRRNLFAGGVIAVLTASALFTVGQKTFRQPQADWNPNHWLRLLRGSNGVYRSQSSDTVTAQRRQTGQPSEPAEIVGRTGYPLYAK
jgi:hypothetical protein